MRRGPNTKRAFACRAIHAFSPRTLPHGMAPEGSGLCPIRHKEFNEFIKGKGFKGRNNYKLEDLKAIFGFKPMITGSSVMISSDQLELTRFDSVSKASTSKGIPYVTLLYAKRNSKASSLLQWKRICNNLSLVKMPVLRGKLWSLELE